MALADKKSTTGEEHAYLLAGLRFDMNRSKSAGVHHLGDTAHVIAVRFEGYRRHGSFEVPDLDTNCLKAGFHQAVEQLLR